MTTPLRTPAADRPEFTWDSVRLRLTWANDPGMRFWGEDSLIDLVERVFSPGDETVRALTVREAELADGARAARMTLYPQGEPVWALAECRIEWRADGRALLWVGLDDIEVVSDWALVRKRAGFDAAPRPMVIFDHLGAALVRNEADRRAYPHSDGAISARYADAAEGNRALTRALAEGAFSHTAMIQSTPVPLRHRISLNRMRDPATGRLCVIGDFTDLSDRPAAAATVAAPERQRGEGSTVAMEALARIAHDVRAPLGAISGFAEMLRVMGDAVPADRREGALADIEVACQRLAALTDRMIVLGGGGGGEVNLSMIDLAKACNDTGRMFAAQAEAADVTLKIDAAFRAQVLADETAVARILDNLTRNALTHGRCAGGVVTLSAGGGHDGEAPWIEVADNGPGLEPAQITAAFDAYRNGNTGSVVGDAPLHGLGLANVMTLAQGMAAKVTIDSSPGAGFAARVTFAVGGDDEAER